MGDIKLSSWERGEEKKRRDGEIRVVFFGATLCLLLSQLSHLDVPTAAAANHPNPHLPTLAPLFFFSPALSLAQSAAMNDSMDTPYRELFWVALNVLLRVTV